MIKVLLVDDEETLTDSGCRILKKKMEGSEVYGAYKPKKAIEIINDHKPNVLIIDLSLEDELNGIDIIRIGKEAVPSAKAFIVTGNDPFIVRTKYDISQVDKIIEKPLKLDALLELAREAGEDFV